MVWPFARTPTWREHFKRGMTAGHAGQLDSAAKHFARATKLAPEQPYPHYELGYTRFLKGDYAGALEELRRAEQVSPGFFLVQREIRLCEARLAGTIDDAFIATVHRIQQLTETGLGQSAEAEDLGRRLAELAPDNPLGHFFVGKAVFDRDPARAEEALRRSLALFPDDTTAIDALTHLGLIREARGDPEAAHLLWQDVLSRFAGNPHAKLTETILAQRGLL